MAPLAQQVTLKGDVNSAPYIMDPSPLASLEEGEQFYFDAKAVTSKQRADFKASGAPFTERQPFYGIFYQGVFVGIATGLAHPVRALLDQGHPVRVAAVRTSGKAQGYQGVELELPETDPFQRWYRFVELGEVVPLDDPIVVVNLNLEGAHRLANGPAKVSVGQIADDRLPVTVSGKDAKGEPVEAVFISILASTIPGIRWPHWPAKPTRPLSCSTTASPIAALVMPRCSSTLPAKPRAGSCDRELRKAAPWRFATPLTRSFARPAARCTL